MDSNDRSSALIDPSSSLLSEHRSQRSVNFNLDPPSYSSVIADDSKRSSRSHGARSSLIESQNSPYSIGSDSDPGFDADARPSSSRNSYSQPPYLTGPPIIRDEGSSATAPYPTAPIYTSSASRAPYPTESSFESSNIMLGFRTDNDTSRPSSRVMPVPVEMGDITVTSATMPYPIDGPSGMPMPQAAPQFQAPIGFTHAVTERTKSKSPTPKYQRSYETTTRSTESPTRSMAYTQLPRRTVATPFRMKQNLKADLTNMNVICGIFAMLLFIAILAVVIKIIVVVRST